MVTFAVADGVAEFQEMWVEASKTNPRGKDKQHGQELQDNYKRCSAGTVGIPKERRKEGAEEMSSAHYLRTLISDRYQTAGSGDAGNAMYVGISYSTLENQRREYLRALRERCTSPSD